VSIVEHALPPRFAKSHFALRRSAFRPPLWQTSMGRSRAGIRPHPPENKHKPMMAGSVPRRRRARVGSGEQKALAPTAPDPRKCEQKALPTPENRHNSTLSTPSSNRRLSKCSYHHADRDGRVRPSPSAAAPSIWRAAHDTSHKINNMSLVRSETASPGTATNQPPARHPPPTSYNCSLHLCAHADPQRT